jgi:hypothetical protein
MTQVAAMLETYPSDLGDIDRQALVRCIEECFSCAQACTACADACLSEASVAELVKCVRTNLDCADICDTTGRVLSRRTGYDANLTRSLLTACAARARPVVTSARRTPTTTSIAGCAPTRAGAASRPAANSSVRWAEPASGIHVDGAPRGALPRVSRADVEVAQAHRDQRLPVHLVWAGHQLASHGVIAGNRYALT